MKKLLIIAACAAMVLTSVSCGNRSKKAAAPGKPEYTVVDNPEVDLSAFKVDDEGYIVLFDGTSLNGWRGYGKDYVPARWSIDDGAIKISGSGTGEAQTLEG